MEAVLRKVMNNTCSKNLEYAWMNSFLESATLLKIVQNGNFTKSDNANKYFIDVMKTILLVAKRGSHTYFPQRFSAKDIPIPFLCILIISPLRWYYWIFLRTSLIRLCTVAQTFGKLSLIKKVTYCGWNTLFFQCS